MGQQMFKIGVAAILAIFANEALAQQGPARVVDGDTLDIAGERIRLHGIDAPERDQTCTIDGREWGCGIAAWGHLVQMIAGQVVRCDPRDVDQYGRTVAVCFADGQDISATMVAEGWAHPKRRSRHLRAHPEALKWWWDHAGK